MALNDIDLSRAVWRTSARSNNGGACVEVATNLPGVVAVRDSKNPDGPQLSFSRTAFGGLVHRIKDGKLDL